MHLKSIFLIIFFCFFLCNFSPASEEITITTYYPSPYGSYNELSTTGNTYLATDSGDVGIGTNSPQSKLDVRGGIKVGDTNTGSDGAIRFHNNNLELYKDGKWQPIGIGISESGILPVPAGQSHAIKNFTKTYTNRPTVVATIVSIPKIDDANMVYINDLTNTQVTFDIDAMDPSGIFQNHASNDTEIHYIVISND